jgi:hypothetical protein
VKLNLVLPEILEAIAPALDGLIDPAARFPYPVPNISGPAAIASYPASMSFTGVYARGMDRWTDVPLIIAWGRPTNPDVMDQVTRWTDGADGQSIVACLEAHDWQSCSAVTCTNADFDVLSIGGTDYLCAMFQLDVVGSGN